MPAAPVVPETAAAAGENNMEQHPAILQGAAAFDRAGWIWYAVIRK